MNILQKDFQVSLWFITEFCVNRTRFDISQYCCGFTLSVFVRTSTVSVELKRHEYDSRDFRCHSGF